MLKTEIDVTKMNQLPAAAHFAHKHKCPAIVVPPDLFRVAFLAKARMPSAQFKIIAAIDWPKGTNFRQDKFRGVETETMSADGFEILLTQRNYRDMVRELKYLEKLFSDYFNPLIECRYVLGWFAQDRDEEQFGDMIKAIQEVKSPTLIRTTHLTKLPAACNDADTHLEVANEITKPKRIPIKLSGNMNFRIRLKAKGDPISRYACTLEQAEKMEQDLSNGALEELKNIVSDEDGKDEKNV